MCYERTVLEFSHLFLPIASFCSPPKSFHPLMRLTSRLSSELNFNLPPPTFVRPSLDTVPSIPIAISVVVIVIGLTILASLLLTLLKSSNSKLKWLG